MKLLLQGSISIDEWESLRSNAVIVLEENDILHEQAENLKKKEEKLFATFQVKGSTFNFKSEFQLSLLN